MTAVYGISVGAAALRLVRTDSDAIEAGTVAFEMRVVDTVERPTASDVRDAVRSLPTDGDCVRATVAVPESRLAEVSAAVEDSTVAVVDDTRAALAFVEFAWLADGYRTLALVDAGATGTSVTIVDTEAGRRTETERSSAGAGRALDRIVVDHLLDAQIVDRPGSEDAERELVTFARSVKESLSTSVLARASGGAIELMSRDQLNALSGATIAACADMVTDAAYRCGRPVDVVVLIGGTARMPALRAALESRVGVPVVVPDEPEAVVAKGAGLLAGLGPSPDDTTELSVAGWLGEDAPTIEPGTGRQSSSSLEQPPTPGSSREETDTVDGVLEPLPFSRSESDSVDTEAIELAHIVDDVVSTVPSAPAGSPYDSPTCPFHTVADRPASPIEDLDPPAEGGETPPSTPSSMRLPRAAAMVLTVLAVASGVLWAVVRPGVEVEAAPATVADAVPAVTTTTTEPTTTTPAPRITTTTTEPTTTQPLIDDEEEPAYVPPRTFTRIPTVDQPLDPTTESAAPSAAVQVPTPTTRTNPFELTVPPIFDQLPIPGF
jgi:hypothetical protein